jgi:hypothetical protein
LSDLVRELQNSKGGSGTHHGHRDTRWVSQGLNPSYALKLQQPARTDRIREEMRKSPEGFEVIPQQKFEAQIISLAA